MKKIVIIFSLLFLSAAFAESAVVSTQTDQVTYYGWDAGKNATNMYHLFLGRYAGQNSSGSRNTFVGDWSGVAYVTSDDNTFLGYYAGFRNTSGASNTFIGSYAGRGQNSMEITGSYNTFVGHNAGRSNTTGQRNTFMGYQSGYANTDGNYNNFIGYMAGYYNTTGSRSTFLGYAAGLNTTTGGNNTFFGYATGYKNITGVNNLYLGNYAGYYATGSGNVFLGASAGYNETGSNKLYIANSNTSTPLIWGDFITGEVKVNGALVAVVVSPSSREYKDNIKKLNTEQAVATLQGLDPVTFSYKTSPSENHVGFIAEDVPALVATNDRKGLGSMDVVAVLTKVVKEQQAFIQEQQKINAVQAEKIAELEQRIISK